MKKIIIILIMLLCASLYSETLGDKVYKQVSLKGETFYKWLAYNAITEYDENGNEIHLKSVDKSLYEVWQNFDSNNNIIYKKSSLGYLGEIEEFYEYNTKGLLISVKTTDGIQEKYEYDENNNLIHFYKINGKEEWYEYNSQGQKIRMKCSSGDEEYEYDSKGNLIHKINYYINSNRIFYETKNEYDNEGRLIHSFTTPDYESWYEYDSHGNQIHYKSDFGEQWFEYDENDHMTYYKFGDGIENWYDYEYYPNGRVKTMKVFMKF